MSISLETHKKLWGRSGNLCAFTECNHPLVILPEETNKDSIIGVEAHIVAKKKDGPRGINNLLMDKRDEYDNLILLCSIHHKVIDDHPDEYSIEMLHKIKTDHEEWVKNNLHIDIKKQKESEIYASYIDEFINLANFDNWNSWTSYLLSPNPNILKEQYDNSWKLVNFIISRKWYNSYPEIKNSFYNFNKILNDLLNVFDKYKELPSDGTCFYTDMIHHISEHNPELYSILLKKYDYHIDLIHDLTFELTRAANYIIDEVRDNISPLFRIKEGMLLVTRAEGLTFYTHKAEYQEEQKIELYPGLRKFMEIRAKRYIFIGQGISEDYF